MPGRGRPARADDTLIAHAHTVSVGARDGSGGIDQAFAAEDDELVLEVSQDQWEPTPALRSERALPES